MTAANKTTLRRAPWSVVAALCVLVLVLAMVVVGAVAAGTSARSGSLPAARPWWSNRVSIVRGARDFATGSCISCHALAGVSNANAAIDLTHEGSRRSPSYLLQEITHPTSDRPATPAGQERDLAAYLASLR